MRLLGRRSRRVGWSVSGLLLVATLGGCSFVPDWADPTDWSYRWANPVNWYEGVFGEDESDLTVTTVSSVPGEDDEFPNLSSVPDRPITVETSEERATVAEGLVADREQARYTDEVIRTGPAAPEPVEIAVAELDEPPRSTAALEEIEPMAPVTPSGPRQALTLDPLEPMPEPAPAVTVAPMEPLDGLTTVPTITALTQPDVGRAAVALTAGVELAAYAQGQEVLSQVFAQLLGESASTVTTAPANAAFTAPTAEPLGAGATATAIPDVVRETYNAALTATAGAGGAAAFEASAAAARGGLYQNAVINFNVGSSRIAGSYRGALQQVVAEHQARGGFIRVVGHASSRTRDLPIDRHLLVNFRISLERAEAVARELVRLGASPDAVFIEARSDTEPVYYESMPAGEAENRRVEVFLEF